MDSTLIKETKGGCQTPSTSATTNQKRSFHSQISSVSFGSLSGRDSDNSNKDGKTGSNTAASTVTQLTSGMTFPRVSLRSLLMSSPFPRRTKPRRGCFVVKTPSAKSNIEVETACYTGGLSERYETPSSSFMRKCSGGSKAAGQKSGGSSLRRSSIGSKSQSSTTNRSKSLGWGVHTDSSEPSTSSPGSFRTPVASVSKSLSLSPPNLPSSSSFGSKAKECSLCLQELPLDMFKDLLTCSHTSCFNCMRQYLVVEITESRIMISCPQCDELMHPTDIHQILNSSILSYKYEDFMLRRVLSMDPDTRWCPEPDCGYAVIASGCASCPKLKCERAGCEGQFCYHCKASWHPNQTCDMARAQRSPNAPFSSLSYLSELQNNDDVKSCPRCQVLIVKMDDGSCNHMTCSVCSAEFCWLCMKEISDLHYLSPSGCTFWGKKPWSRKKKIMWQLGTLVGAPLGIGLVAGLAVPAMLIGIPIWVGRKLHSRYADSGKHKRNLVMVGGITASAIVSPVLAGLAVSIGVPILLAYVYGVVPISLCRSGGCGVTTSSSGVRIAFDDEKDMVIGIPGRQSEPSQSLGATQSIGEVSCQVSLSAESGTHLLAESDRESASNTAIAPASLTGSIASSCLSRAHHRHDIQLDIVHGARSLASVDTTSLAMSERSTNTIDTENASTKALAAFLMQYKLTESESEGDSVSGVVENGGGSSNLHIPHVTNVYIHPAVSESCSGVGDNHSMHSNDMRLDSVSAIITARQMSGRKGVRFDSMDHIALPSDTEEVLDSANCKYDSNFDNNNYPSNVNYPRDNYPNYSGYSDNRINADTRDPRQPGLSGSPLSARSGTSSNYVTLDMEVERSSRVSFNLNINVNETLTEDDSNSDEQSVYKSTESVSTVPSRVELKNQRCASDIIIHSHSSASSLLKNSFRGSYPGSEGCVTIGSVLFQKKEKSVRPKGRFRHFHSLRRTSSSSASGDFYERETSRRSRSFPKLENI